MTASKTTIHPTAVIDPRAKIGPYVIVDGQVKIGRGTRVMAHTYLAGWTEIGEGNSIHMGAVIGHEPLFRRKGNLARSVQELESGDPLSKKVVYFLDFIKSSERGVCFCPRANKTCSLFYIKTLQKPNTRIDFIQSLGS